MSYSKFGSADRAYEVLIAESKKLFTADKFEFYMNENGLAAIKEMCDNGTFNTKDFETDCYYERTYRARGYNNSFAEKNENFHANIWNGLFPYGVYAVMRGTSRIFYVTPTGYASKRVKFETAVEKNRRPKDAEVNAVNAAIQGKSWFDAEKGAIENIVNYAIGALGDVPKKAEEVAVNEPKVAESPLANENAFMGMLHTAFVNAVGENLVAEVMPTIKEKIIAEFGFVPERHEIKIANKTTQIDGVVHKKFDLVANLVANNMNPYLCGPAGTGKNVLAQQVAKALGLDFYTQNSITDEYKFTGFVDVNGNYVETEFYKAFTKGGLYFLDEMDASAPEVLVNLNMAIANRMFPFPTGTVEAHEDFRVIAAGNTLGTGADASYVGRMQLDAATLNRFAVVVIDYDERIDTANANGDAELVEFAKAYRKAAKRNGINTVCSYRNIKTLAIMSQFCELTEALESGLVKELNKDDVNILAKSAEMPSGNKWVEAFKNVKPIEW